ncbi:MAG TPA: AsmA-like C-terminal region-containing protein [Bacteroidia bacterium]|nr:AsmA-like C-terminal region-containing protein [Bacteroidia bacterium]
MSIVAFPDKENLNSTVNGEISINDGSAVYGPRSMPFNNINSYIRIQDKDVFIDQLSCITGVSKLSLKGEAPGLIDYLSNKRKDANLKWTIKSPYINLNDLTAFLSKRKSVSHIKTKSRPKFFSEGSKLDNFLDQCSLDMKVDVTQLVFDNFSAKNITGHVVMIKNEYFVKNLHLNHADGDISLNGSISGTEFDQHRVHAEAILKNVNISKTFASFDNFSQTAVTDKNIAGIVQANAVLDFEMNQKAVIRQSSLEGAVDLTITDGEIKGFQPLGKLSDFLFPNRNFTEIKFSELTNLFTVKGDELFFERMKINSSVMEMYVEGSYFLS